MCGFSLLFVAVGLLIGQVEVGVTGGIPLREVVDSTRPFLAPALVDGRTNGYVLGPGIAVPMPGPLRLQGGFTLRRFSADSSSFSRSFSTHSRFTGNHWDIPILITLPLRLGRGWQAYAGAGPSFRFVQGVRETGEMRQTPLFAPPQVTPIDTSSSTSFTRRFGVGAALEAGLRWRVGPMALSPAVRITQWDSERTATTSVGTRYARPQVDLLLSARYVHGSDAADALRPAPRFGYAVLVAYTPRAIGSGLDIRAARWAVGALLEWRARRNVALEGSFLLRTIGHTDPNAGGFESELRAKAWEVPLLLRVVPARLGSRWSFGLGPAARFISHQELRTNGLRYTAGGFGRSSLGVAAAAGLRYKAGPLLLRPELRYQWFANAPYEYYPIRFAQHQFWLAMAVGR